MFFYRNPCNSSLLVLGIYEFNFCNFSYMLSDPKVSDTQIIIFLLRCKSEIPIFKINITKETAKSSAQKSISTQTQLFFYSLIIICSISYEALKISFSEKKLPQALSMLKHKSKLSRLIKNVKRTWVFSLSQTLSSMSS